MAIEALDYVSGTDDDVDDAASARARVEEAGPDELLRQLQGSIPELAGMDEALDLLRAADRMAAWTAALQAQLVTRIHEHGQRDDQYWSGREDPAMAFTRATTEIAPLLRLSETGAARLVSESLILTGPLSRTREELSAGQLNRGQAAVIIDQCGSVPADAVPAFEETILARAGELTPPKLRQWCRRLRQRLHPESMNVRRAKAAADRYVYVEPADDGMAWLNAYLPAEQAMGIYQGLTTQAEALRSPDEPRTLAQLRTDVLVDLLTVGGAACSCTTDHGTAGSVRDGLKARVFVTVPVLTLLGGSEPGELEGYGPIDPRTARELAAGASSFTRILTHPETGVVLSVGRDRYTVPKDLRNWLQVRDKTCRHPGCNRHAAGCEVDHTTAWSQGGQTRHENLSHLCKRHHMLKSQGVWHYSQPEPGTLKAVSPGGRSYTTTPDPPPQAMRAYSGLVASGRPQTSASPPGATISQHQEPPF